MCAPPRYSQYNNHQSQQRNNISSTVNNHRFSPNLPLTHLPRHTYKPAPQCYTRTSVTNPTKTNNPLYDAHKISCCDKQTSIITKNLPPTHPSFSLVCQLLLTDNTKYQQRPVEFQRDIVTTAKVIIEYGAQSSSRK